MTDKELLKEIEELTKNWVKMRGTPEENEVEFSKVFDMIRYYLHGVLVRNSRVSH